MQINALPRNLKYSRPANANSRVKLPAPVTKYCRETSAKSLAQITGCHVFAGLPLAPPGPNAKTATTTWPQQRDDAPLVCLATAHYSWTGKNVARGDVIERGLCLLDMFFHHKRREHAAKSSVHVKSNLQMFIVLGMLFGIVALMRNQWLMSPSFFSPIQ